MTKRVICNLKIPEEIAHYLNYNDDFEKEYLLQESNVKINHDSFGRIISIAYYTPDEELIKIIFYENSRISKINNYKSEKLYSTEEYTNDLMLSKVIYKSNGDVYKTYKYDYNREYRISRISMTKKNQNLLICYKYDSLGRIIERNVCLNDIQNNKQKFSYDILDRIINYEDKNQILHVNNISQKNELLSYVITDTIGNNIIVENHFADCGYICTSITVNGHTTKVNDLSYVDNIMLKKPSASDEDLDLIISNLFNQTDDKSYTRELSTVVNKHSMGLIDKNIENRTLPISLRKRMLYNLVMNENK